MSYLKITTSQPTWIAAGHFQLAKTMKKRNNNVEGAAVGYNWFTKQTKIHQLIPPKYPILFEYNPLRLAQRRTIRKTWMKLSRFGVNY